MTIIFAHKIRIYSFPLGKELLSGYNDLVTRVCEVKTQKGNFTGFLVKDTILTSGLPDHDKEFDIQFYRQPQTSGFLLHDFDDIMEVAVGNRPDVDRIAGMSKHPLPPATLYVIGNFFGLPFEIATCQIELVGSVKDLGWFDEKLIDTHTCGSPVFNASGAIVGIVEAYVPSKDRLIIRSLTASEQGTLR